MEAAGCGLCSETKSIVAFCRKCKEFMCDDCEPPHKRMKIFSGHETVPVNNVNNTCAVLSANNTYDFGSPVQVSLVAPTATIDDVSASLIHVQTVLLLKMVLGTTMLVLVLKSEADMI